MLVIKLLKHKTRHQAIHLHRRIVNCSNNIMESCKIKLSERLSTLIHPVHYKLKLQPDLVTGKFNGDVAIDVVADHEKNYLCVHTKFLDIKDVKVFNGRNELSVQKYFEVDALEQLYIQLDENLKCGNYQINIEFSGDLTRNIVGFYLSRLKEGGTMVASKFQPTYARQAFPCFDEPEFKATYDITLVKPIDYVALSNMNEISRTVDQRTKTEAVTFATSVPMSTYLACFVICNFDFKETTINANGIGKNFTLRSFAQKDQTHKIDFAQDIGKRATEFYIQYYEVPFPLPKLDMIAIPDYVSGATEHWGLITYRETSFLVDEAKASSKNKIGVANTIAHELAHMWFGNLVTMKWWDEVWLNEGFASYMQVKALNAIEPSWTMLDQFLTKTLHSVLVTDAKLSSHPIVQTVETPDQITAIFDSISYNKGASILRMLEGFIGEENFRKGVSEYLQKYKFGNTVTRELLMSLEPHFKKDYPSLSLQYIMDTWTKQMGYPVITVTAGDNNNKYILTQSRFLLDKNATYADDSEYHYKWLIPITYTTNKGKHQSILWFSDSAEKVELTLSAEDEWLKINNNQVGYYRVNYPIDMWENLIRQLTLKSEKLTISDRAHLLNDAFALSEAGHLPYNIALNLTTYLIEEKDYVPWDGAASTLSKLSDRLFATPAHDNLKKYIQHLIKRLYLEQSWEKTNLGVIEGLLRTRVLSLATANGLSDAENKVRELFLTWLNSYGDVDAVSVEPDLRDFVYYQGGRFLCTGCCLDGCTGVQRSLPPGMKSGSEEEWDKLWRIYIKEEDVQEQTKIRTALSAPKNTGILRKYLDLAWDEKNIRSQDYLNVVQLISGNPSGTALVWDQVRSNWPQLVERFTLNSRYLGNLIPGITSTFNTQRRLQEMEAFFEKYPEAGAGATARKSALETVRNNIKWASSYQDVVASWLENRIKMFE